MIMKEFLTRVVSLLIRQCNQISDLLLSHLIHQYLLHVLFHCLIPYKRMTYTPLSHSMKVSIHARAFAIRTNFRPIVPNNEEKSLISLNQRTKPGSSLLILLCRLPAYSDSLRLPSIICACAFQLSTCSNKVLHLKARHSEHIVEKSWARLCFITLLVCVCVYVFKLEGSYTHTTLEC